jgi:serine/threonine-protein kinase RsbW
VRHQRKGRAVTRPAVDTDGHRWASDKATSTMRLELAWCLPRRAATVSMARRFLDTALIMMGVAEDCRADLALAVTEACANAVRHAYGAGEYQLQISAGRDRCVVEVTDRGVGAGSDHPLLQNGRGGTAANLTERGRGLRLIRACTDTVEIHPVHPRGLAIRMVKTLTWNADAPAVRVP